MSTQDKPDRTDRRQFLITAAGAGAAAALPAAHGHQSRAASAHPVYGPDARRTMAVVKQYGSELGRDPRLPGQNNKVGS